MMRQLFLPVFLLLLTLSISGCGKQKLSKSTHLRSIQGQVIDFPSESGQWVILNFWASWCTPCLDEISELNRLNKLDNVKVVGVNVENLNNTQVLDLIQKLNINYPILVENPHQDFSLPPYPGIPATYILSPEGVWLDPLFGKQSLDSILKYIA